MCPPAGPNLVANPSFETDLTGWTFTSSRSAWPLLATRSTAWATDGVASMDLFAPPPDGGTASDDAITYAPADANQGYLIRADLDIQAVDPSGSTILFVRYGRDGGFAAPIDSGLLWLGTQHLSFVTRPSTGYDHLGVDVSQRTKTANAELMVDDVRIQHLPDMLANSGFETDLSGWTVTPGASIARVVGSFSQPGNDSSGVAYMDFSGDGSVDARASTSLSLPASPCIRYHALATYHLASGAPPTLEVQWYDVNGALLMTSGGMGTGLVHAQSFAPPGATQVVISMHEPAVDGGFDIQMDDVLFVGEP